MIILEPTTQQEMLFTSELPDDITQVIEKWRKYSQFKNAE